jgi:hypothetical protein
MSRALTCVVLLLTAAPLAAAPRQAGEPIPLTLSPAALPEPASRYRLLPDRRDQVPGNAAALYYRSMAAFAENRPLLDELKGGQWDLWLEMPLDQLPRAEVAAKLAEQQYLLRQLEQAARCKDCDWELAGRPEGIGLLLPEVQTFRAVVRVVAVQARYEVAGGHVEEALRALQPGYAFAHRLGDGQTLIHVLVGAAMAAILDNELEEILQQPGAPNLYWALTVLPRPFLDTRSSIDEEGTLLERMCPGLKLLDEGPMSPEQMHAFRREIARTFRSNGFRTPEPLDYVAQAWAQTRAYPEARRSLMAEGMAADEVDAMPMLQVVALAALRRYHRTWDDYVQWVHVRDFGDHPGSRRAFERCREAARQLQYLVLFPKPPSSNLDFFSPPPLDRIYRAISRTDRRFAALRCVEAIRLYADGHDGRLPASLKDITEVPVPEDPRSGKPFLYEAHGDRAKLSAPVVGSDKTNPFERLTYEITLRH